MQAGAPLAASVPHARQARALPEARGLTAHQKTRKSYNSQNFYNCRGLQRSDTARLKILTIVFMCLFVGSSLAFKCRTYDDDSIGEIVPRRDIKVRVGEEIEVFCNYKATVLHGSNVIFKKIHRNGNEILPSEHVNASSIRVVVSRSEPDEFLLSCFSTGNASQHLCSKKVWFGYIPLALENFTCVSPNWKFLNCSWDRPANPVRTTYSFSYFVPNLVEASPIEVEQRAKWVVLERSAFGSRDSVTILVTGNNSLGVRNFTYPVDVYSIVVPSSPLMFSVKALGSDFAEFQWELDHLMDAFPVQLKTELAWRILPNDTWTKSVSVEEYANVTTPGGFVKKHTYGGRLSLPYAHQSYEVRVRMHTGQGSIREQFWSQPSFLKLTTFSTPPDEKVTVNPSCYETNNFLQSREIFVYWREIDPYLRNGPNFHYQISAKDTVTSQSLFRSPLISKETYVKFPEMANNVSYSFEIRAVNDVAPADSYSIVVVPPESRMPSPPQMFTVIKYRSATDLPLYRLMWTPPALLGAHSSPVVRYTLFWCPRPAFDLRCQEDLEWDSTGSDLESLVLRDSRIKWKMTELLYERNMTGLPQNRQFGIAAVAADGSSSGIKWATCSVPYDDSPPAPRPPSALSLSSRSVKLSWSFDCPDKSAVLLSIKISYCEVDKHAPSLDFSNCVSNVTVEESPLSEHAEITGLRPSSSMIFSLSVVSVVGTSRNSLPVGLQLPEDVPSGPPLSLSVESASNVSLSLRWEPPPAALTNGELTHYIVSTQPPSKELTVPAPHTQVTVSHLSPFTWYRVFVCACTRPGCARTHPATESAHTLPGLPSAVDLFSLNSIDGEMSWAFPEENCHSSACTFDVRIVSNSSNVSITGLEENSLSLQKQNITCEDNTSLNVSIRAVGTDANNSLLYGPWNSKEGPCTVPAISFVPWWIWFLVVAGILVPFICFVCAKCGFSVFLEMTGPVKVPDLKSGELKNSSQKKLKPDTMSTGPTSGQVLFNPPYASLPNPAPTRSAHPFDVGKRMPLLSQSSVNSEMDNNEDSGDRHARNLSGNSSRSSSGGLSEVDSALASIADGQDSASASSHDSANICLRQSSEGWPPLNVRQRSPGPYVLHGQRPTKVNVCEGYVAVRSDPSLHSPNLGNSDGTALAHFLPIKPFPIATRCPNSAESDQLRVHPSYSRRSSSSLLLTNKNNNFTSPPHSNASSPLPAYSRHSFTPPGQPKHSPSPADIPVETDLDELQYVSPAFNSDYSRLSTPESVTDQTIAKQRPSTIASNLSFEKSVVKNGMPDVTCNAPGAYSVVGKRKNVVQPVSSSQGYVTLSNQIPRGKFPSFLGHASTTAKNEQENSSNDDNTPYLLNSSQALPSSLEISANYCTLEDLESLPGIYQKYHTNGRASNADNVTMSSNSSTMLDSEQSSVAPDGQKQNVIAVNDRWAFSNPRPRQLDFADEVRFVASAPIENHRGRKCSQKDSDELHLPSGRPNTSDGVGGRPHHLSHSPPSMWVTGAPSLSKQSSGYVSQEALSTEPLVISPKRLFAHSQEGKSSKSIPQEVSFV